MTISRPSLPCLAGPAHPERLFTHQQAPYEELRRVASAFFCRPWDDFPIRPRSNVLVTGPTGLGKTELARIVAAELEVPLLELVFTDWLPMGGSSNRGSIHTWPMILKFIKEHDSGVIFIDEVDKAVGTGDWSLYIRLELFSLLDKKIPENIDLDESDDEDSEDRRKKIADAQRKLLRSFLIVGAGAFQELCETRASVGIGFQPFSTVAALELRELAGVLPRELTNRFRSRLINLPPLRRECYLDMLRKVANRLPAELAPGFLEIGENTVEEAIANQQGVRWLEEILLDAVIAFREIAARSPRRSPEPEMNSAAFTQALPLNMVS